jgi:hypothetical protein
MPFPSGPIGPLYRLTALPVLLLVATSDQPAAQHIGAHSDAADARIDALFATPER